MKLKVFLRKKVTVWFTFSDGEIIKQFRKAWERNDNGSLDKVMEDISKLGDISDSGITNTVEPETESLE